MDFDVSGAVGCYETDITPGLFMNTFNGGAWETQNWQSSWTNLGGSPLTAASCAEYGVQTQAISAACAATGTSDSTLNVELTSGAWMFTGFALGRPSCFALDTTVFPGRVMCVVQTDQNVGVSVIGP
jgi:hypothetical protein